MSGFFYEVLASVDGVTLDLSHDLSALSVEQRLGSADRAELSLVDPHRALSHALGEGVQLRVRVGDPVEPTTLFEGEVQQVQGQFPEDGAPGLRVVALDASLRLRGAEGWGRWREVRLSELVRRRAQEVGLEAECDLEDVVIEDLQQQGRTTLALLRDLAERYGCELYMQAPDEGGRLRLDALSRLGGADAAFTLSYGLAGAQRRLLDLQPSAEPVAARRPKRLQGRAWGEVSSAISATRDAHIEVGEDAWRDRSLDDYAAAFPERGQALKRFVAQREAARARQAEPRRAPELERVGGAVSALELEAAAKNGLDLGWHGQRASGRAQGLFGLRARQVVALEGVGAFSGRWFLTETRHQVDGGGHHVDFQVQR